MNKVLVSKILTGLTFLFSSSPLGAEISVSYSVGEVFIASYSAPSEINSNNVQLASKKEYSKLIADVPVFFDSINIVKRSSLGNEFFISTSKAVNDEKFEMIFVDKNSRDVIDRYEIIANKSGVTIEDVTRRTPIVDQNEIEPFTSYNTGNSEIVSLLSKVSRQLSNARLTDENTVTNPILKEVSKAEPQESQQDNSEVNEISVSGEATYFAKPKLEVELQPIQPQQTSTDQAVVTEVRLATANMKNFVLTLIAFGFAFILSTLVIVFKMKKLEPQAPEAVSKPDHQPYAVADSQLSATKLLDFMKDESLRSHDAYLKSIELLLNKSQTMPNIETSDDNRSVKKTATIRTQTHPHRDQRVTPTVSNTSRTIQNNVMNTASEKKVANDPIIAQNAVTEAEVRPQVLEKINLAQVYQSMGDIFVAQDILNEIIKSGNAAEVLAAREAIRKIGEE